jgi:hypothetical protein
MQTGQLYVADVNPRHTILAQTVRILVLQVHFANHVRADARLDCFEDLLRH